MSSNLDEVLSRLSKVTRSGQGWLARCPCRDDDQNPSLTVAEGGEGQVLLHCHRGAPCSFEEICSSIGMEPKELAPANTTVEVSRRVIDDVYDYVNLDGELLYQVVRYALDPVTLKKDFRQRHPVGGGKMEWGLGGAPKVIYRWPEIDRAIRSGETIWVVEGEKDVKALVAAGYQATCNSGGAGKWLPEHSEALDGALLVKIVADNDEAGLDHARRVTSGLRARGIPAEFYVPPAEHKDVAAMLGAGLSLDTLIAHDAPLAFDPFSELVHTFTDLARKTNVPVAQKVMRAQSLLDTIAVESPRTYGRVTSWRDFLDEDADDSYHWLIPGLLEEQERVIVVAGEGAGKTTLARQVALCVSHGINPFNLSWMPAVRTLFVDLENPDRIIRRAARKLDEAIGRRMSSSKATTADANLWTMPDGMNVLDPADRAAFEMKVDELRPQLICMGPMYKFFLDPGTSTAEATMIKVVRFLDHIRTAYGCALWLEHHAPLGNSQNDRAMRPFGSAVWSRWPEFGFGLTVEVDPGSMKKTFKFGQFRGPREERPWPNEMVQGNIFPFEVNS